MVILQGSDKTISLTVKDADGSVVNLSGYSAAMHVRRNVRSDILLDSLHSSSDRIVITPLEGKVDLVFPNEVSTAYDFTKGVYDLEFYIGDIVTRIIEGTFTVRPEVTRQ